MFIRGSRRAAFGTDMSRARHRWGSTATLTTSWRIKGGHRVGGVAYKLNVATHSTWYVCGNISSGWTSSTV